MAGIVVSKVVREFHSVKINQEGEKKTFGELVDEMIGKAVEAGDELTEVRLAFDEMGIEWRDVQEAYKHGETPVRRK